MILKSFKIQAFADLRHRQGLAKAWILNNLIGF